MDLHGYSLRSKSYFTRTWYCIAAEKDTEANMFIGSLTIQICPNSKKSTIKLFLYT